MTVRSLERAAIEFLDSVESDELDRFILKYQDEFDAELLDDPVKLASYIILREGGAEPRWAMNSACGRMARMAGSDGALNEHARHRMNEFVETQQGKKYLEIAKKAGVTTEGKYFMSALGPPESQDAWVSTADDVIAVCKKRNLNTLDGSHLNVQTGVQDPKKVDLNPRIVDSIAKAQMEDDPALAQRIKRGGSKAMNDLRAKIKEKHARKRSA